MIFKTQIDDPGGTLVRSCFFPIILLQVDIDEAREVAQQYNVTAVPTFIFFRGGERLFNMRGCNPTTLETKITELLSRCPEVERVIILTSMASEYNEVIIKI